MTILSTIFQSNLVFLGLLFFGVGLQVLYIRFSLARQQYQHIYALSPTTHQKKIKTPTMGGLPLLMTVWVGWIWMGEVSVPVMWCLSVFTVFCLVGLADDVLSQRGGENKGFSARKKLGVQLVVSALAMGVYHLCVASVGVGTFLFDVFLLTGVSNATNLTDGLDGLLGGLSLITLVGFFGISSVFFPELSSFILIVMMAVLAFLSVNLHPANVFMGDTGSLGLGALFAAVAIVLQEPFLLLALGGVYVIETLSVMIQVFVYKCTRKRVFLMAPLHHHFELMGFEETYVVAGLWILGAVFLLVI